MNKDEKFDLAEELRVKPGDIFDKEKLYEDELEPLVKSMRAICARERIPFVISTAVKNSESETVYRNDGVLTGSLRMNLFDDHFEKFLLVLNGGPIEGDRVIAKGVITNLEEDDELKLHEALLDDEYVDPDIDEEEDELSALFDAFDADINAKAEKAINTKKYITEDGEVISSDSIMPLDLVVMEDI